MPAVQGAGGGGILSLGSIIISDLVPLSERGLWNALLGLCVPRRAITSIIALTSIQDMGRRCCCRTTYWRRSRQSWPVALALLWVVRSLSLYVRGRPDHQICEDLNLPICAIAALLVLVFLKLRAPKGSFAEKLSRMDWMCVCESLRTRLPLTN